MFSRMKAGTHKGAGRYQAARVDVRGITWNWIWSWVMSSGRSCRRFDSFSVTMRSITVRAIAGTSIATVLMGGLVQAEKGILESHEPYVVGHVDAMFGEFAERADRYGVRHAQFSCSRWRELSCEA